MKRGLLKKGSVFCLYLVFVAGALFLTKMYDKNLDVPSNNHAIHYTYGLYYEVMVIGNSNLVFMGFPVFYRPTY